MKTFAAVYISLTISVYAQNSQEISSLTWLEGHWKGSLGRASSEELWMPPAGGAMLGVSRMVAGPRMVAFEFLRIETRADGIYYVAQPNGRPPTAFKLVRSEANSAVFENPEHDHPKVITYLLEAPGRLLATIEGEVKGQKKKQEFRFEKAEKR